MIVSVLALLACSAPALPVLTRADSEPTARPTRTVRPSATATETDTVTPANTATATSVPATATSVPPTTAPAVATNTPGPKPPTNTPRPPTNTPPPAPPTNTPVPPAKATPAQEFSGSFNDAPDAHSCKVTNPFIAVRVVDRTGKPLPGYYIHVGRDGNWSYFNPFPTTSTLKDADKSYAYNADFLVAYSIKYYVTLFRQPHQPTDPFNISESISNEVTAYFPPRDDDNCAPGGSGSTVGIRVAPITFVYNR